MEELCTIGYCQSTEDEEYNRLLADEAETLFCEVENRLVVERN